MVSIVEPPSIADPSLLALWEAGSLEDRLCCLVLGPDKF